MLTATTSQPAPRISWAPTILGILLAGIIGYEVYTHWPTAHAPTASVMTTAGTAVPDAWPAGQILGLTAGSVPAESVRWEFSPASIDAAAIRLDGGRSVMVAMPIDGTPLTYRADFARGSRIATTSGTIEVGTPNPRPKPKPGPGPSPIPVPIPIPEPDPVTGPTDPKLVALVADYFKSHAKWYEDSKSVVAAASPNFNEVFATIASARSTTGAPLSQYLDTLFKTTYDATTLKVDPVAYRKIVDLVANSHRAGLAAAAR